MMARGAVRDVGRAMNFPLPFCDKIAKLIPMGAQGFPMTIDSIGIPRFAIDLCRGSGFIRLENTFSPPKEYECGQIHLQMVNESYHRYYYSLVE